MILWRNKQCCFCWLGFLFPCFEQQCPAKVLTQKPKQMKMDSCGVFAQHWTFLLCDNEDEQRASDSPYLNFFLHPLWLLQTQTAVFELHTFLLLPKLKRQQRLVWNRREPTNQLGFFTETVCQKKKNVPHEKHPVCLLLSVYVCVIDRTTLPLLHSQRLQWEITFLVNLIFFLSGLTFH